MAEKNNSNRIQAGVALFVVAAIIIVGTILSQPKTTHSMNSQISDASSSSSKTSKCNTAEATSKSLKGTYKANGSYDSPGGVESIVVSLTLNNNVVTAADVESKANDPTASSYQHYFINGFKPYVIGKKISDIKLSNVSGSSLTSQGFNAALKTITCEAEQA
jgi:hypothetical protein